MIKTNAIYFIFLFLSTLTFGQNNSSKEEESNNKKDSIKELITVNTDTLLLSKTSEMLNEDIYWAIVANSLKENSNPDDQEVFLINEIEKLSPKEIIGFRLRTDKLLYDSYSSDLWCAAYIIDSRCSDDGFDYFRCWLISRGKEIFYKTKINPDSLITLVKEGQETYEFEGFLYVAVNAFNNKTNEELYSYIDTDHFITNDENYPLLNFTWDIDEPQTMQKICPLLYEKLWK